MLLGSVCVYADQTLGLDKKDPKPAIEKKIVPDRPMLVVPDSILWAEEFSGKEGVYLVVHLEDGRAIRIRDWSIKKLTTELFADEPFVVKARLW